MNHGENRKPPRNVETGFHVRCTPRLLGRLLAREPRTAAAAPIRFVKVDSRARTAFKHPRAVVVSVMARRGVYNTVLLLVAGYAPTSKNPPRPVSVVRDRLAIRGGHLGPREIVTIFMAVDNRYPPARRFQAQVVN